MRKNRIKRKTESGQALVEFVICLPVLITILCAILDFGWLYMNEYEVNHASYEAARYAALHNQDEGMTKDALEYNMEVLVNNNLHHEDTEEVVEYYWPPHAGVARIRVTKPVHMLTYVGITFFGKTYDITVQNAFYVGDLS